MAVDQPFWLGTDAEDAFGFVRTTGIVRGLTNGLDDEQRARALDALHATIVEHDRSEGVAFGSGAWLTSRAAAGPMTGAMKAPDGTLRLTQRSTCVVEELLDLIAQVEEALIAQHARAAIGAERHADVLDDAARVRRQHVDAGGEEDRLLDVVGHEQDRRAVRCQTISRNSCIARRVCASSAPNGSSRSRMSGSGASARAIATRWRIPPESSLG